MRLGTTGGLALSIAGMTLWSVTGQAAFLLVGLVCLFLLTLIRLSPEA